MTKSNKPNSNNKYNFKRELTLSRKLIYALYKNIEFKMNLNHYKTYKNDTTNDLHDEKMFLIKKLLALLEAENEQIKNTYESSTHSREDIVCEEISGNIQYCIQLESVSSSVENIEKKKGDKKKNNNK